MASLVSSLSLGAERLSMYGRRFRKEHHEESSFIIGGRSHTRARRLEEDSGRGFRANRLGGKRARAAAPGRGVEAGRRSGGYLHAVVEWYRRLQTVAQNQS